MIPVDLHCHSNASDGLLSPAELVQRAAERGCKLLALTDHDDLRGLPLAAAEAQRLGLQFINGVEISVSWGKFNLHIVGLNIDPSNAGLQAGLAHTRSGRDERAVRMAESLARAGIEGALEGARKYAENPEMISRAHFARYLVEIGKAKDVRSVFNRYLRPGLPGYVEHEWARLHEALEWIHGAGGVAVLAHPARYEMGNETLRVLLTEFKRQGGDAIEVVSGCHSIADNARFGRLAKEFGYECSCGTDYHATSEGAREPGLNMDLPQPECIPVWRRWTQV